MRIALFLCALLMNGSFLLAMEKQVSPLSTLEEYEDKTLEVIGLYHAGQLSEQEKKKRLSELDTQAQMLRAAMIESIERVLARGEEMDRLVEETFKRESPAKPEITEPPCQTSSFRRWLLSFGPFARKQENGNKKDK